jgi:hypothetical protein
MEPGWLVESASLWGYHGAMLADSRQAFHPEAVNAYWLCNRTRFDAWTARLTQLKARMRSDIATRRAGAWSKAETLIEEVLMSEPLCRVCVAVATRLEHRQIDSDSRAILHNVFRSHQETRQRCLQWILDGLERGNESAERLNRIRAYLENWTDMLLGFFSDTRAAEEYCFSTSRVAEFSEEYGYRSLGSASSTVWSLLLAGNRKWLNNHCSMRSVFPKLGKRVCQAALGMVHPLWFDSLGLLPSKTSQSIAHSLNFVDRTVDSLVDGSWQLGSHILTNTRPSNSRF